ncbi:MAG: hypothetical protein J6M35_07125 [Clostridia bacterium]|nr:hypothetical protein [Clostridia bacterium]
MGSTISFFLLIKFLEIPINFLKKVPSGLLQNICRKEKIILKSTNFHITFCLSFSEKFLKFLETFYKKFLSGIQGQSPWRDPRAEPWRDSRAEPLAGFKGRALGRFQGRALRKDKNENTYG